MNADRDPVLEEEFSARLLACEEALAMGTPPSVAEDTSPEMRSRLLRNLACLKRLQQLRPQHAPLNDGNPEVEADCPVRIGRFEIRGLLGSGGFGIVYRAYDPVLCREVALKIPRADALVDADCQARFQQEARVAARLHHPNLVPVHEAGQLGPICYIAFAYCPGSDLATWLKQPALRGLGPVRCMEAASLLRTLARAIHYAHGCGILHRDLKPSNILLSPVAPSTTPSHDGLWLPEAENALIPRVTDFGLAKFAALDQAQTGSGQLLGTPCYMAPEQTEGLLGQVGPATDVHALGAILYEVVTGRPPFLAESPMETLLKVKTMEPERPSRLRRDLPRDLETICLTCLHKEPRKRYASAEALAEDLRRFQAHEPILARPLGPIHRFLRWRRRNPMLASMTALTFLALLFSVAVLTLAVVITGRSRDDALRVAEENDRNRQKAENLAKENERGRKKAERDAAYALYERSLSKCELEGAQVGLHWLARSLHQAMTIGDADLEMELRAQIGHWVRAVYPLHAVLDDSDEPRAVAMSADGQVTLTAGSDRQVRRWKTTTGASLGPAVKLPGRIVAMAIHPDQKWIAVLLNDSQSYKVQLLDWQTSQKIAEFELPGAAEFLALSPDGTTFVASVATAKERFVYRWDTDNLLPPAKLVQGLRVCAIAFSPDGETFWTGDTSQVQRWDVKTGARVGKPLEHGGPNVFGLACSRDGKYILSGGHDRTAQVWNAATGEPLGARMKELRGIYGVAFSADETQAITCGLDAHARFWDWRKGTLLGPPLPQRGSVRTIHATPDGRLVLITSLKSARIWKTDCLQPVQVLDHGARIKKLRFSPDGTRFLTSGSELLELWNVDAQERLVKKIRLGYFDAIIQPSPDGKSFVAYRDRQKIRRWDFASGEELPEANFSPPEPQELSIPKVYQKQFMAVHVLSPNGKTLLTGGHDNTARLWDAAAGRQLGNPIEHRSSVPSVAFNGDGTLIATGSQDGTVRFWFAASGRPLGPPLHHGDLVIAVEFHPTRKILATGCFDCKARFWQIPDPVQGDGEQIADWLRVVTGLELGNDDLLHALDGGRWKECRERYTERGL